MNTVFGERHPSRFEGVELGVRGIIDAFGRVNHPRPIRGSLAV
jgi:hypothetical protein